jgi:outer membrane protein assembly factor BamB
MPNLKITPPLTEAWTLGAGGRIVSSAVVSTGKVYVGSLSGKLVCADLKTGKSLWQFQTGGQITASPAVADGMVYCGSDDGNLYALDAATGTRIWQFKCGGPVQCSPAVAGGVLYFGANDHHFYALDRTTGKKLWSLKTSHPLVITTPVVHGDTVYMAQWVDWVYALDAATGEMKWRDCVPISIEKLHFYQDRLYLRSARQIAEYDPATGRRLRLANAIYGYNGLAFMNNLVFSTGIDSANAVNLNDKGELSRYKDQPALKDVLILKSTSLAGSRLASMGTPLVIGDLVCFASRKGEVVLIQPELATTQERVVRQKTVWSTQLGDTCHGSPSFADGYLLIGCDNGKLYAFREK